MNKFFLTIILIFANTLNAQKISGYIYDSITKQPIKFANVVLLKGSGVYSDEDGKFTILIKKNTEDSLKISSLEYKTKTLPLLKLLNTEPSKLRIGMENRVFKMEEIVLQHKNNAYTKKLVLGEEKNGNIGMSTLIGFETALFIENLKKTEGKISKIYIDLKKRDNADFIALFDIKFYEYDIENNRPGKHLYTKNMYIKPENKKYRLWIDVKNYNIKFPKNGICIGVELIDSNKNSPEFSKFGPAFRYTISNNSKQITWTNYQNKGWSLSGFKSPYETKNGNGFTNPMIGLEVLFLEKND